MALRWLFGWLATAGLLASLALPAAAQEGKKDDAGDDEPVQAMTRTTHQKPPTQAINTFLAKAWAENEIKPSRLSTDYEFCRRLYLDLLGRIAKPEEVREFVADTSRDKRGRLIYKLLFDPKYTDDFAAHWATIWTNWLMTRSAPARYRNDMRVWLEDAFSRGMSHKEMTEKLIAATGKSDENGAVNFILQHSGDPVPAAERSESGQFDAVPITSRSIRLFLGIQVQCAQCHDHPFNPDWQQRHFWGVNTFFRQVKREGPPAMRNQGMMQVLPQTLLDDPGFNTDGSVFYEARNGKLHSTKAKFLDNRTIPSGSKSNRREVLAQLITSHDNFAKAYINRLWAHFFGRGLNENPASDDFGEHNKVVHPELLDRLAKDFIAFNYNPRELMLWICNSDAYNLSSVANTTNIAHEAEPFFSRMLLKAMSPEQLFESLMVATKSETTGDARKQQRDDWMRKLVRNFGDDEGNEITFNGTVVQALLMMNGREINAEISRKDNGVVAMALAKYMRNGMIGPRDQLTVLNELFMTVLNRPAKPSEIAHVNAVIAGKIKGLADAPPPPPAKGQPKNQPQPKQNRNTANEPSTPQEAITQFYQDVFWALLNCNEFILNH